MPSSKPPKATVAPLLSSAIWGVGGIASSGYRLLALDLRQGDVFQSTLKEFFDCLGPTTMETYYP